MISIQQHIKNLEAYGYTIIKKGVSDNIVDNVVKDLNDYIDNNNNPEIAASFAANKRTRICNFHRYSKNTLDLVTNKYVNEILRTVYGKEQVVYTSLTFKYGTSQDFHRDTPHFYTNKSDQYHGVWYALEDININSGPLKYYIGSHKLKYLDGQETFNNFFKENQKNIDIISSGILEHYNKILENSCIENNLECVDEKNYKNQMEKGDIIIWDSKLVHGGSNVIDPSLTRYSMVTHNIPINVQVFNAKDFFTKEPTIKYFKNECDYKYKQHNEVSYVDGQKEFLQNYYI